MVCGTVIKAASIAPNHPFKGASLLSHEQREIETFRLGKSLVIIRPGLVKTILSGGAMIDAIPHSTPEYATRAQQLGYVDSAAMNADHDLAHALLAAWLGLPVSPALLAASRSESPSLLTGAEEDVVLALQKFANLAGVTLMSAARTQVRKQHENKRTQEALTEKDAEQQENDKSMANEPSVEAKQKE